MSLALRNLRQLPAHAEAIGVVADEAQLGVPGPDLEHALRLLRLLAKTVGALVDLQGAEAPVHAEQEMARLAAALEVHAHLALEGQALLLKQAGHALLP